MAWETGTATGHVDLLSKLATFLSTDATLVADSEEWELLRAPAALPFTVAAPNGRIGFTTRNYPTTMPDPWPLGVPANDTRMKITATLTAPSSGLYTFAVVHEDWAELRINGALVMSGYTINQTSVWPTTGTSVITINLTAGDHAIDLRLISRQGASGNRGIGLGWRKPGDASTTLVPAANLSAIDIDWGINYSAGLHGATCTSADFAAIMADQECALKGKGAAGTDEIYVNLYTRSDDSSDIFNLVVRGATGFDPTLSANSQPGQSSANKAMLLWELPITYWFFANGRRFIVIAKVSTSYESMYAGLGMPYGLPTEFPYMLVIGASSSDPSLRFSDTSNNHTSFWNPGQNSGSAGTSCLEMRDTAGIWQSFTNYYTINGFVYPTNAVSMFTERPPPDGSYALTPLVLYTPGANVYGELDGAYHVSGFANASENTITIGSDDYLVVQSSNRTGSTDYVAIKLA